jgi:hypothetical protein
VRGEPDSTTRAEFLPKLSYGVAAMLWYGEQVGQ